MIYDDDEKKHKGDDESIPEDAIDEMLDETDDDEDEPEEVEDEGERWE